MTRSLRSQREEELAIAEMKRSSCCCKPTYEVGFQSRRSLGLGSKVQYPVRDAIKPTKQQTGPKSILIEKVPSSPAYQTGPRCP
ncbi:hypothetical protein ACE6H2_016262 [Prunus campanulata]